MNKAKHNYKIYNCKMLAITEALKNWHMYLKDLPQPFEIITNHHNLEFWHTAQNLMCCQAHWALLLTNCNFVLIYKLEVENSASDRLFCQLCHKVSDAKDNNDQVVLSFKHFHCLATTAFDLSSAKVSAPLLEKHIKDCLECKSFVAKVLKSLKAKESCWLLNGLFKWKEQDGLVYYRGKLYISNNKKSSVTILSSPVITLLLLNILANTAPWNWCPIYTGGPRWPYM
jgi:hypothetical protein